MLVPPATRCGGRGPSAPSRVPGRAATVAGWMPCSSDLFVFVWFSDNRRFTVFVRFAAVVLLFFIVVVVGVSRRNCGAGEALPGGNVHGVAWGHVNARWMSRVYGGILLRVHGKRRSRGPRGPSEPSGRDCNAGPEARHRRQSVPRRTQSRCGQSATYRIHGHALAYRPANRGHSQCHRGAGVRPSGTCGATRPRRPQRICASSSQ